MKYWLYSLKLCLFHISSGNKKNVWVHIKRFISLSIKPLIHPVLIWMLSSLGSVSGVGWRDLDNNAVLHHRQAGQVMCRRMVCDCDNPNADLFCCPECDPRLSSQCLHQNGLLTYGSGDTWVENCQQCQCLVGPAHSHTHLLSYPEPITSWAVFKNKKKWVEATTKKAEHFSCACPHIERPALLVPLLWRWCWVRGGPCKQKSKNKCRKKTQEEKLWLRWKERRRLLLL